MEDDLISNYFKSIIFKKSPYSYLGNTINKYSLPSIMALCVIHIVVSGFVYLSGVLIIFYLGKLGLIDNSNIAEITGESAPAMFILIQIAITIFILIQTAITYFTAKFVLKKNSDFCKYIISNIYVSSILLWLWIAWIAYLFGGYASVLISMFISFIFIYRNITSAMYVLHAPKYLAYCITTWPIFFILLIFIKM